jgi:VanZ family protein
LYALAIFAMSSVSEPPAIPGAVTDKAAHSWVYAGLSALTVRALAGGRWSGVSVGVAAGAVALCTAYGVTDEVHQFFVPGREADRGDVVADAAGASMAAALAWLVARVRVRRTGR